MSRFGSIAAAGTYAGLVPSLRETGGKATQMGITKQGSRLLRWAVDQAVRHSARWRGVYERLK